ncbi:hypothetical protein [Leptolyngbya sp. 7M]|uniref:hypothetical protein n=1 Tax=Leptolyngbya sp. 7M TaxID=2812896 RepID=UPI0021F21111|nr:hypothetical protein [Leptolyngbya sp. 7M]
MTQSLDPLVITPFPDHTQLPESDGTFVFAQRAGGSQNFQEHPQSLLLTDSLDPVLERLHPNGTYVIGQDYGIYWRQTDPPERGSGTGLVLCGGCTGHARRTVSAFLCTVARIYCSFGCFVVCQW